MPSRENDLRASFERSSLTIVNQSKADGISPSVFKEVKTSTTGCGDNNDIEGGAIRAGGAPDLFSKDCIGLLVNYASVGLVLGMFPRTVYPFLQMYLYMDGYQGN